jgi:hypothetical protein
MRASFAFAIFLSPLLLLCAVACGGKSDDSQSGMTCTELRQQCYPHCNGRSGIDLVNCQLACDRGCT